MQTQISQLNTEREELLGKIEAGDGAANTAIQQLKLQNVRMRNAIYIMFRVGCATPKHQVYLIVLLCFRMPYPNKYNLKMRTKKK